MAQKSNRTFKIRKSASTLARLIIWDETPVVHKYTFEALDKMLRDITECQLPFGEKVIMCGGDFRQVLPIEQRGTKDDIMKLALVENMRAKLDPSFCDYLLNIRNEIERIHSCQMITLPEVITINIEDEFKSLKKLIEIVFPNFQTYGNNLHNMINRIILTLKNKYVDLINNMLLKEIPREKVTYFSFDEMIDKSEEFIDEDFLSSLVPNSFVRHIVNVNTIGKATDI
ncbi:uncharacterized protein LOC111390623 [Olea europaea var. sylvestris]|uniref:uncharacterized protein LOC111390623 n=1 Tax=Olea europaea var. sylvestris TaxID=158386 RepID=UPI000C1D7B02|nr:uncharacterized protein LOC111390623 [Olea europaea var. sylvestris]